MKWPLVIILSVAGLVELIIRLALLVVMCVSLIGMIIVAELADNGEGISGFVKPICFEMAMEIAHRDNRPGEVKLSKAQRREIEYLRLKNEQLARTNELEREQIQWVDKQLKRGSKA